MPNAIKEIGMSQPIFFKATFQITNNVLMTDDAPVLRHRQFDYNKFIE